jgi:hypothetical protein
MCRAEVAAARPKLSSRLSSSSATCLKSCIEKDLPVPWSGRHEHCVRRSPQGRDEGNCLGLRSRRREHAWMGEDAQRTTQHVIADPERLGRTP